MQKIIYTDRLSLRVLDETDASMVLDFYQRNTEFFEPVEPLRTNNFYTIAFQKAALYYEYNQIASLKSLRYYVFLKEHSNKIIGTICFSNIIKGSFMSCQIGYKFDHDFQKKGYATEAIKHCITILFDHLGMHRIEANILPSNTSSINLIEKLGFHNEGIAVSSAKILGEWKDHVRYALINKNGYPIPSRD